MSQGQRMDQEKAVSRGASDSAVAAAALLDSTGLHSVPLGFPATRLGAGRVWSSPGWG